MSTYFQTYAIIIFKKVILFLKKGDAFLVLLLHFI